MTLHFTCAVPLDRNELGLSVALEMAPILSTLAASAGMAGWALHGSHDQLIIAWAGDLRSLVAGPIGKLGLAPLPRVHGRIARGAGMAIMRRHQPLNGTIPIARHGVGIGAQPPVGCCRFPFVRCRIMQPFHGSLSVVHTPDSRGRMQGGRISGAGAMGWPASNCLSE
jgi:hypothetical protein